MRFKTAEDFAKWLETEGDKCLKFQQPGHTDMDRAFYRGMAQTYNSLATTVRRGEITFGQEPRSTEFIING